MALGTFPIFMSAMFAEHLFCFFGRDLQNLVAPKTSFTNAGNSSSDRPLPLVSEML